MKEPYFLIVLLGNPYDESARAPVHDLILKLMMDEWATTTQKMFCCWAHKEWVDISIYFEFLGFEFGIWEL